MKSIEETPNVTLLIQPTERSGNKTYTPRPENEPSSKNRAKRLLAKTAITAAVLTGTLVTALQYDIYQGKEAVADSHPSIEHVYNPESAKFNNSATIILPGFGTRSAKEEALQLESHTETGHVFSLEYSNKDIDIDKLTETVINGLKHQAETNGVPIQYLNFDGVSAGGVILLAVAANIHENYPDITITSVTLNSSPIGKDGLTQESSQSIETMSSAIDFCNRIKLCSGIEYSNAVHHILEITSRHDQYYDSDAQSLNLGSLGKSISQVNKKLSAKDAPSLVLALNQASAFQGASNTNLREAQENFQIEHSVNKSIKILAAPIKGRVPVTIFYTMAEDPTQDSLVNVEESSKALQAIARKYDAQLEIVPLNVGHVNLYQKSEEYNEFIASDVNPVVERAIEGERLPPLLPLVAGVDTHYAIGYDTIRTS